MESINILIIALGILTGVFFVAMGIGIPKSAPISVIIGVIGGVFWFTVAVILANNNGMNPLKNLDGDTTYVFQSKVVDPNGKLLYVLYDLKDKKNRMAFLETYPPQGYQEMPTSDGRKFLVPAVSGAKASDGGLVVD